MKLKPGELAYGGRRINPATHKFPVKDLRRLVGRCSCGKALRGIAAIPAPDPFANDVHDDPTPVVQCRDCIDNSSDEV